MSVGATVRKDKRVRGYMSDTWDAEEGEEEAKTKEKKKKK